MNAQELIPRALSARTLIQLCLGLLVLAVVASVLGEVGLAQKQSSRLSAEVTTALKSRNYQGAMKLLAPAIERGDVQARTLAGLICAQSLTESCPASKAVKLLTPGAETGNSHAQYALALALFKAQPSQAEQAHAWLEKAAKAENEMALFALGQSEVASGKPALTQRGVVHVQRAAELGFAPAQFTLAVFYEAGTGVTGSLKKAARWYRAAAEQGHTVAQTRLGSLFERGRGVTVDAKAADRWYHAAAEAGYVQAQYSLGMMYMLAEVVEPQYFEGIYWLEQAAEAGYAKAQDALGRAYNQGVGVRKDNKEALRWFILAGKQGHLAAQNNAGAIYEHDFYLRNFSLAAQWYERAAKAGHEQAMINLGGLYQTGNGVKENISTAQSWYTRAAMSGDPKISRRAREHMRMAQLRSEDIAIEKFGTGDRFLTPGQVVAAIIVTAVTIILLPQKYPSQNSRGIIRSLPNFHSHTGGMSSPGIVSCFRGLNLSVCRSQ